jgi:hypothetical protein
MGYERPTLKLVFADPEMDGLEVRARRMSLGELQRLHELSAPTGTLAESQEQIAELYALLATKLISWNLEVEGVPVPLTVEGLAGSDVLLLRGITTALRRASTEVPAPLDLPSTDGDRSLEESMAMEIL